MTRQKRVSPVLILLLAGCSMIPGYETPTVTTPAQWSGSEAGASIDDVSVSHDWWASFGSEELNKLMNDALLDNNDLRAELQRVEQSRAALKIAGASLLPSANVAFDISKTVAGNAANSTNLGAGSGISYELDLFGANRAVKAGASASLLGSQYAQDALKLVVMGDVAQTYFSILNNRERLRIADQNLHNAREVLRIVTARVEAGTESSLELSQQKSALASSEAARASIEQQINKSENALAVLLGKPPQSVSVALKNLDSLTVPNIKPGQPSSLLSRRPDIRAAEMALVAANADIGVARAAFFPSVNLGADWSVAASGFGNPATTALALASSLSVPLFQGGRLEGGVEKATARQAELAENYRKSVLVSFQEVEDALASIKSAQLREQSLNVAKAEAENSYNLSKSRYDAGAIDFQTLLDTQGALLNAEDSYAQAKFDRLLAAVDLFKALGGGWASDNAQQTPAVSK